MQVSAGLFTALVLNISNINCDWYLDTFCERQDGEPPSSTVEHPWKASVPQKNSANCLWIYERIVVVDEHINPHAWLSVGESNKLPQDSYMQIWFIHVGVQCKNDQRSVLISRHT